MLDLREQWRRLEKRARDAIECLRNPAAFPRLAILRVPHNVFRVNTGSYRRLCPRSAVLARAQVPTALNCVYSRRTSGQTWRGTRRQA